MDTDFLGAIIDEVALEGLDGITLQGLWVRLKGRPHFGMTLDEKSKVYLWKCLLQIQDFEFYELPEARADLVVENRLACVDPESGNLVDYESERILYPVKIISEESVKGSCAAFYTRKKITDEIRNEARLSLCEVNEKYGNKLVIVASKMQRRGALFGPDFDPSIELPDVPYCLLEKIGRGRHNGELSRGSDSLQMFKLQPKTMFYFTLILIRNKLIKKQRISVTDVNGKNILCALFHLTRLYSRFMSKYAILTEKMEKYLSQQPGNRQELFKAREDCKMDLKTFKRLYVGNKAYKVYTVPYSEMYPEATDEERMCKSRKSEKIIRVIELNKAAIESDEESDEEGESGKLNKDVPLYSYVYERTMIENTVKALEECGPEGISRVGLTHKMGLEYYDGRLLSRSLENKKLAAIVMTDKGRQKEKMYIANKFLNQSQTCQEISSQMTRLKTNLAEKKVKVESTPSTQTPDITAPSTSKTSLPGKQKGKKSPKPVSDVAETDNTDILSTKSEGGRELLSTGRNLKRMNLMLETVRENKIIEGDYTLLKIIREKEKLEGSKYIFDKRSMLRILNTLIKDQKVRSIKTVITAGSKMKELHYLTDMSIQPDDQIILSLIAQSKVKLTSIQKERLKGKRKEHEGPPSPSKKPKIELPPELPESAKQSILKLQQYKSTLRSSDMKYDGTAPKFYGYKPKYQKAKVVHKILWYLVYGIKQNDITSPIEITAETSTESKQKKSGEDDPEHTAESESSSSNADPSAADSKTSDDQARINEVSDIPWKDMTPEQRIQAVNRIKEVPVFLNEMSWKRHLTPLPTHFGFGKGWCLLSDVLLKLPLCIFCNVVPISYRIPGLKELVDHPTKCLYPVISLPESITQQLLFARKYIYSFFDTCAVLATMGLLSLGPQIMKEKDKTFIYLHEKASLVGVTGLERSYYTAEAPPKPTRKQYVFDTQESVDQYWHDLQRLALRSDIPTEANATPEPTKDEGPGSLKEALRFKSVDEIVDDGSIPGNEKGFGGFDSSLYIHLTRSWSSTNIEPTAKPYRNIHINIKANAKKKAKETKAENLDETVGKKSNIRLPSILPKERLTLINKETMPETVSVRMTTETKGNRGGKGIKRKSQDPSHVRPKKAKTHPEKKKKEIPKPKLRKRVYDEADETALKKKSSMRVKWTSREDSLLLTCKIGSLVMDKKRRGVLVPWSSIRDVVHKYAPNVSKDKTSCACQRRVSHSLKNPSTKNNMMIFYSEAMQDEQIRKFADDTYLQSTETTIKRFHELVDLLVIKFSEVRLKDSRLPQNLSEVSNYEISSITKNYKKVSHYDEVKGRVDILQSVLHCIYHSYVSCQDKQGRSHEMYRVLNQYPDSLLESTAHKMRSDGLIVRHKTKSDTRQVSIQIGLKQLKLSQRYHYRFNSKYPSSIFTHTTDCMKRLWQHYVQSNDEDRLKFTDFSNGGICACLIDFMVGQNISFRVTVPKDIVILDPTSVRVGRGLIPDSLQKAALKAADEDDDPDEDEDDDDILSLVPPEKENTDAQTKQLQDQTKSDQESKIDEDSSDTRENEAKETRDDAENMIQSENASSSCTSKVRKDESTRKFMECMRDLDGTGPTRILEFKVNSRSIFNVPEDEEPSEQGAYKEAKSAEASRALITIRRSCVERQIKLRHFNIQDNFVIDALGIYLRLMDPHDPGKEKANIDLLETDASKGSSQDKQREITRDEQTSSDFDSALRRKLFLEQEKIKDVLQRLQKFVPFQVDMETVWESISSSALPLVQKIYKKIDDAGELGIRKVDLKKSFEVSPEFFSGLQCLLDKDALNDWKPSNTPWLFCVNYNQQGEKIVHPLHSILRSRLDNIKNRQPSIVESLTLSMPQTKMDWLKTIEKNIPF